MSRLLARPRFQNALKALLLLALAAFLYTRLAGGTLFFYINQRFMVYTLIAIVGLLLVALSYRPLVRRAGAGEHAGHGHAHGEHAHQGDGTDGTDPADRTDHAGHNHALTWTGAALVLLPIVLGVLVPPQPLGAAALSNREVEISTRQVSSLPAAIRAAGEKNASERNILDWLHTFSGAADPAAEFAGQPVAVSGFVFRDDRFADDQFMVTRFVVSCCVADANVAGMVVRWPDAATLPADQWVQVEGLLAAGELAGDALPVIAAQNVAPIDVPQQPYLYP
jgi:uncharacterized repeat protein (TIGR03943 family)